jgi:hypothetical protein
MASKSTGYNGKMNGVPQDLKFGEATSPGAPEADTGTANAPTSTRENTVFDPTQANVLTTTMPPTPAPQMPFFYGPPEYGPIYSPEMLKLMTSVIFNLRHPATMIDAITERHWGAHASTILGRSITWTLWNESSSIIK